MKHIIFSLFTLIPLLSLAQENQNFLDKVVTGESTNTNPVLAKKEIQEDAINKTTEDLIKELIGADRVNKNKTLIQNRIQRQWSKYIPYLKNSDLTQQNGKFAMTVHMKISLANLRSILRMQGFLVEESSKPVFIPMVGLVDRVNGQLYQWWRGENNRSSPFLSMQNQKFENLLGQAFFKSGLQLIEPTEQKLALQIPTAFQNEKWSLDDDQFLTLYFQANVVLEGQITIEKHSEHRDVYWIDLKIAALQISNGRVLADLHRRLETEKGPFNIVVDKKLYELFENLSSDLSTQVFDVWQRGAIGANSIKVSLKGRLSPLNQELLKERLKSNLTQIKTIKERLITTDVVVYEIDTTSNSKELSQKIQEVKFPGFQLQKLDESDNEITFQIQGG